MLICAHCHEPINVGHTLPERGIVHSECADARDLFRIAKLYAQSRCLNTARRLLRSALILLGKCDGNRLDAQLDHRNYVIPVLVAEGSEIDAR